MDIATSTAEFLVGFSSNTIANGIIYLIIVLSVLDFILFFWSKSLKPVILSLGIFGTFLGIFVGLYEFNTDEILDSVPKLLEGLKTAFITSIVAMFAVIVLQIIQKFLPQNKKASQDSNAILQEILEFLQGLELKEKLNVLNNTESTLNEIKDTIKTNQESLNAIPHISTKLDTLNQSIKDFSSSVDNKQNDMQSFLTKEIEKINSSLNQAIETLSKVDLKMRQKPHFQLPYE